MVSTHRTAMLLVLCLIAVAGAGDAQETLLAESQKPPIVLLPTTLAPPAVDPLLQTVETKSGRELAEKPWFWRFLEGMAIGAATYNTQKQSDGRPQVPGKAQQ